MKRLSIALLVVAAIAAAAGQIFLKLGASGRQHFAEYFNALILAGLCLYAVGTVIWIYVLSSERLINVFAFSALTFVLVVIGGAALDGSSVKPAGLVGVALILSGLYVLTKYNA
jgi:undecaprenyl phosphate-alpha-L-ara4N flippase subunit ArnE